MIQRFIKAAILGVLGTSLGCMSFPEKTIKDVPTIKTESVQMKTLPKIPKNKVALSVVDERAPDFKQNSEAVRSELTRAVTVLMQGQEIAVQPQSPNTLVIAIQDYKSGTLQKGCVRLNGTMTLETKAKVTTSANSCIEYTPSIGNRRGTDISQAYEQALQLLFESMGSELQKF